MDSSEIGMIIIGVVLIAVGIFGMVRPDILYRNVGGKKAFGSGFRRVAAPLVQVVVR